MCEWFDETIGELTGYLDDHQLAENTIVVYACDNGWITRTDNGAYTSRSKRSQYDGGTRTPIMVRWTGHMTPKNDTVHLASTIDMVPTVLDAVGLKPTQQMQGISLLDQKAVNARDTIYGEIFEHDIQSMDNPVESLRHLWIIEGKWKLILPNPRRVSYSKPELFNIVNDPTERRDRATGNPKLVKRLSEKIAKWYPEGYQPIREAASGKAVAK